jgi:hypothetical protein
VPEAGLDGFGVFSGGDEPGGVGVAEVVWHAGLTDGSGDGFAPDAAEGSSTEEPSLLGGPHIQVTMDRYGHLMEGLDSRTADRLDQIGFRALSWVDPSILGHGDVAMPGVRRRALAAKLVVLTNP